jgi:hypothetical protein
VSIKRKIVVNPPLPNGRWELTPRFSERLGDAQFTIYWNDGIWELTEPQTAQEEPGQQGHRPDPSVSTTAPAGEENGRTKQS